MEVMETAHTKALPNGGNFVKQANVEFCTD